MYYRLLQGAQLRDNLPMFAVDRRSREDCARFVTCNSRRCLTCDHANTNNPSNSVRCHVTGRQFSTNTDSLTVSCDQQNIVYLISCKLCGLQYVGETTQKLKARFLQHRRNVRTNKPGYLYEHFRINGHSTLDMQIKILDCIPFNEKSLIRERENIYIRTLVTAWPFGLNDRIDGYGDVLGAFNPIGKANQPYFGVPLPRIRRSHVCNNHKRPKSISNDEILVKLNQANPQNCIALLRILQKYTQKST